MARRRHSFKSRMASRINARRFLRRASRKSAIKRRKYTNGYNVAYKYIPPYKKQPIFDSTEEFLNFLFGTIIAVIVLIMVFPIFKNETIDIHDVINNNFIKTEQTERIRNSNNSYPTEFEKRQQEKFKEHTAY